MKHWKWTEENIQRMRDVAKISTSISDMIHKMEFNNGHAARRRIKVAIEKYEIPIDHFTGQGWNKGKTILQDSRLSKYSIDDIFSEKSPVSFSCVRSLVKKNILKEYKCESCGISQWKSQDITLQLDHINGNRTDNRLENLRWLCPNCHSQTPTFCSRNRKSMSPYSDDQIISLCMKHKNLHSVVKELGCNSRLYPRIRKLAKSNGILFEGYNKKKILKPSEIDPNWRHREKHYCRKVERPTKEKLEELIKTTSYVQIGKMYGVSDNAVRKWVKYYKSI